MACNELIVFRPPEKKRSSNQSLNHSQSITLNRNFPSNNSTFCLPLYVSGVTPEGSQSYWRNYLSCLALAADPHRPPLPLLQTPPLGKPRMTLASSICGGGHFVCGYRLFRSEILSYCFQDFLARVSNEGILVEDQMLCNGLVMLKCQVRGNFSVNHSTSAQYSDVFGIQVNKHYHTQIEAKLMTSRLYT